MRLVLDTNDLIAAFITRGVCTSLFQNCAKSHTIVCSEHILGEFGHHLVYKFRYAQDQADAALTLIWTIARIVVPAVLESPVCRDSDDDPVIGTAVAGGASCIITGDKDLLVLESYQGIAIIKPGQFDAFEAMYAGRSGI